MKIMKPKDNSLTRKAVKAIADHYAKMFAQIALQEGISTVDEIRDHVLSMSVNDFCDYKFIYPDAAASDLEEVSND